MVKGDFDTMRMKGTRGLNGEGCFHIDFQKKKKVGNRE